MDHVTDPALIRQLHNRAIDAADIIFYSGRKLLNEASRGRERSYLLEQAADFDHWSRVGTGELGVAPEVARIARPRLGYFGAIEPWLIDQELIKRASRERPLWQWVFIGNRSRGLDIEGLPNAHFLPAVPYNDLPRYAAGFDVCVLPWETEQSFTSYGSAIKVREYLATGKPVVISPLPEYESMRDVLRIARSGSLKARSLPGEPQKPATEMEAQVLKLWEEILGFDKLGVEDEYTIPEAIVLIARMRGW